MALEINAASWNSMWSEATRLQTFYSNGFNTWPKQRMITAEEIANSGFYYLYDEDRVQCPWCNVVLRDWSTGDRGMTEHKRHSSQCLLILQPDLCGNIPIDPTKTPKVPQISTTGPKNPQFADARNRLETYEGWPRGHCLKPKALVESGFFYTGHDDNVRCFCCDFGLKEWNPEDDPWWEHARWSGSCKFVLDKKGVGFVNRVKNGEATYPVNEPARQPAKSKITNIAQSAEQQKDSPVVEVVLRMGYEWDFVKRVIVDKLKRTGEHFKNRSCLLVALFDYDGERSEDVGHGQAASEGSEDVEHSQAASKGSEDMKPSQAASEPQPSTSAASPSESTSTAGANSQEGEKSLLEEIERLKDLQSCKICMDENVSIVFLPCGHMCACSQCADLVKTCPICRLPIKGRVNAFLS